MPRKIGGKRGARERHRPQVEAPPSGSVAHAEKEHCYELWPESPRSEVLEALERGDVARALSFEAERLQRAEQEYATNCRLADFIGTKFDEMEAEVLASCRRLGCDGMEANTLEARVEFDRWVNSRLPSARGNNGPSARRGSSPEEGSRAREKAKRAEKEKERRRRVHGRALSSALFSFPIVRQAIKSSDVYQAVFHVLPVTSWGLWPDAELRIRFRQYEAGERGHNKKGHRLPHNELIYRAMIYDSKTAYDNDHATAPRDAGSEFTRHRAPRRRGGWMANEPPSDCTLNLVLGRLDHQYVLEKLIRGMGNMRQRLPFHVDDIDVDHEKRVIGFGNGRVISFKTAENFILANRKRARR